VEIYGSKRWINVPLIGQFQPSEAAKMVVVIALASWFTRWQTEVHTFLRGFVLPGAIIAVPIGLIAAETDVGTALSLSVAVGAVMFCVGTRLRYMVPSALAAMAGAAWFVYNNPNRWGRIEAWLDLENPVHQLDRHLQAGREALDADLLAVERGERPRAGPAAPARCRRLQRRHHKPQPPAVRRLAQVPLHHRVRDVQRKAHVRINRHRRPRRKAWDLPDRKR
jgi:hypothetical protein